MNGFRIGLGLMLLLGVLEVALLQPRILTRLLLTLVSLLSLVAIVLAFYVMFEERHYDPKALVLLFGVGVLGLGLASIGFVLREIGMRFAPPESS